MNVDTFPWEFLLSMSCWSRDVTQKSIYPVASLLCFGTNSFIKWVSTLSIDLWDTLGLFQVCTEEVHPLRPFICPSEPQSSGECSLEIPHFLSHFMNPGHNLFSCGAHLGTTPGSYSITLVCHLPGSFFPEHKWVNQRKLYGLAPEGRLGHRQCGVTRQNREQVNIYLVIKGQSSRGKRLKRDE